MILGCKKTIALCPKTAESAALRSYGPCFAQAKDPVTFIESVASELYIAELSEPYILYSNATIHADAYFYRVHVP